MNWLALAFALELGVLPNNAWVTYEPPGCVMEQPEFYQQFEVEAVLFRHLWLFGSMRVYDWMVEGQFNFFPSGAAFHGGAGLIFPAAWGSIQANWHHFCGVHPLTPYMERVPQRVSAEGSYDELSLRIEVRVGNR